MFKVLQLIDSLDAGGAERMAVNIANELAAKGHASHLIATRKEGLLESKISSRVFYHFLNKKGRFDFKALKRLRTYVIDYNIEIIHAHSSSFFLACLVKIRCPKIKVIWHDHYGNAELLNNRPIFALRIFSRFFDFIISVNQELKQWSKDKLGFKRVKYLRNFAVLDVVSDLKTDLPGNPGKRIVHLANFRPQKNHLFLLKAFKQIKNEYSNWSLLLVGKSFDDDYYKQILYFIEKEDLNGQVFIIGSRSDVHSILGKCDLGVLSSTSEGLPLALIEYGLSGLPVIATNVGACREVLGDYGELTPVDDVKKFSNLLSLYIADDDMRLVKGQAIKEHVSSTFGAKVYISELESIYRDLKE